MKATKYNTSRRTRRARLETFPGGSRPVTFDEVTRHCQAE